MKAYVALTYLKREEWSKGTVWQIVKGVFELGVRECLKSDKGDEIAAHVSLFFEDASDRMVESNVRLSAKLEGERSFCVDVLQSGNHTVSLLQDKTSWYQKWHWARVEFYEIVGTDSDDIERAHTQSLLFVERATPYDCFINVNSLFPYFCMPCSFFWCCCCCACPCYVCGHSGVNCVGAVLVAIASARGVESAASQSSGTIQDSLGIPRRAVMGGRLPKEAIDDLIHSGQLNPTPVVRVIRKERGMTSSMPLLAVQP